MGSDSGAESGPDLQSGIPLSELGDGKPFLGHLGEDRVVLVRQGEEVLAIGGVCTHYGGPLGEGLVTGDKIHCPWHHACFSLRTGEATGAPALNPVPTWKTEIRDSVVYLGAKIETAPLATHGRSARGPDSVVIVGAGAAGSAAAETLRAEGYAGPISLIDPDSAAPYDRPNLSKDYLAGHAPEEWIPLRPGGFYAEHRITQINASVESIDVISGAVHLSDGRELRYGALLLATGATPIRLKIPGADLQHVHTLRSLRDCRAIIAAAEHARSAVVLGASFIGMECAASLRDRGLDVTVVAPEQIPFERTLGRELGLTLKTIHEEHGTSFRLGRTATAIGPQSIFLDDGTQISADLVIVGVGVRPATELAEQAGLEVNDGVIVDDRLKTSAAGVFAAGDIARYPDRRSGERIRVEHWVAAQRQGQAAARNILGRDAPFVDPPFFWCRHWDVTVQYVGFVGKWDDLAIDGDPAKHDTAVRYRRGGRVMAVATIGRDLESLLAEADIESGE